MDLLQVPSTTIPGVIYKLTIDENDRSAPVRCTCTGFTTNGYCKHIKFYKQLIAKKLYGNEFIEKVIKSFKKCYDFVEELCIQYPEVVGDYDRLDYISAMVLDAMGKHYTTETIHRNYRLLVNNSNGKIKETDQVQIRKEKTEEVMHNINKWAPSPSDFSFNQKILFGDE